MNMIILSELLLKHGESIHSFAELITLLQQEAIETGTIYFQVDIEPPAYSDRPHNWQDQLELAFESAR